MNSSEPYNNSNRCGCAGVVFICVAHGQMDKNVVICSETVAKINS